MGGDDDSVPPHLEDRGWPGVELQSMYPPEKIKRRERIPHHLFESHPRQKEGRGQALKGGTLGI